MVCGIFMIIVRIQSQLAASVPGLLFFGWLSDRWPLRAVITLSCLGSALACLLLWGFATSIEMLVVFVIAFGALGLRLVCMFADLSI